MYQPLELKYALNKVGVKALIAAEFFKNRNYYSILNEVVPELSDFEESKFIRSREIPTLESVIMISNQLMRYAYNYES